METYVTTERPTRYAAHARPGVWIEQADTTAPGAGGGFEYGVFHEPTRNFVFPAIECGIYVSICQYQTDRKRPYLLDAYVDRPDWHRDSRREVERFATYTEAKAAAERFIAEARAFVAAAERDPRLCDCCRIPLRRTDPARCERCARSMTHGCSGCRARRAETRASARGAA